MKIYSFLIVFLVYTSVLYSQKYPETKITPITVTKHKVSYQDDYSWLENMRSEEVNNWVDKQNEFTEKHFDSVAKIYSLASKLKEYDTRTTYSLPQKKGKYFYAAYRKDRKKPSSLYFMKSIDDEPVEIVNPNNIYPEKTVTLNSYFPSKNSANLAYKISIDGSDNHEIRFVDLFKKKGLDDVLKNVKFSNVSWNKDRGIFYKQNSNKDFFAQDSTFKLYYHKIGSLQDADELILDATYTGNNFVFFTSINKLFVIETNKTDGLKSYYYGDLEADNFKLNKFIENDESNFEFINYHKGRIYFSSKKMNWGDIRSFDIQNRKDEKTIIPQIYTHLLVQTFFSDEYLICKYKTLGKNYIIFYDYDGKLIRKIEVPNAMDIQFMNFDKETKDFYFGVYSYTMPFRNFKVNIETGTEQPFYSVTNPPKPTLFPLNYFETKSITYKSRDNVDIPITIIHKKGLVLDGNNPTLLEAYGGFGIVSSNYYDTGLLYFLEKGGVFAYAEIRGGGEKGEKWHEDGMGLKKMNCFNDFIDAAEYLIKEKYTSPNKLAITGGSQGGLLVGVAMTKRPELFKVAIPKVGVFDMAIFKKYTAGKYWLQEYGNVENEKDYNYLLNYSPFQNVKKEIKYPTTLIITSENDDRVPPLHSYKFAAALQNSITQKNTIYLKTTKKAGHYGNSSTYEKRMNEKAEFYSFLMYHLNQ
ncbi:prolyl oligopeptidase family serine peptidase [Flavobacterium sp.]|uniref:prolyl oligopeptidase family serine peptidase n=1 Tax=Flavobacterium sp. TaxID=239 RepID=UPI003752F39B